MEQAGGRFTSLTGEARADAGSACSTNGLLHDEVLSAFAGVTAAAVRHAATQRLGG